MPTPEKEALTLEPWQAGIGLAMVVLIAGVAMFTAWDRMHNSALETVVTPTAVGDMHFVPEPKGEKGPLALKYQGRQLDMVSESKLRDSRLIRVGSDDSGVYTIYRPEDEKLIPKDHFLMKIKTNEFMEVSSE